jgi:hypothetical protein
MSTDKLLPKLGYGLTWLILVRGALNRLGMKVERKLSDFSAEKWKGNKNMKMETEICGRETEKEIIWRK